MANNRTDHQEVVGSIFRPVPPHLRPAAVLGENDLVMLETVAEKRAMRERLSRVRPPDWAPPNPKAEPELPYLDKVPARKFFAALGIEESDV